MLKELIKKWEAEFKHLEAIGLDTKDEMGAACKFASEKIKDFISDLEKFDPWIDAADRLPESRQRVIVRITFKGGKTLRTAADYTGGDAFKHDLECRVGHNGVEKILWMPYPEI